MQTAYAATVSGVSAMTGRDEAIRAAARKHGLSEGAVAALWEALVRGGGRQAQFSHPELGGMGQWSGGMGQIGDMFNTDLKARVGGACADLAAAMAEGGTPSREAGSWQRQSQGTVDPAPSRARTSVPPTGASAFPAFEREGSAMEPMKPMAPMKPMEPMDFGPDWWPADLGRPSSSGAQNGVRYAVFPDRARLAIERDGKVVLYDTGRHRIGGVSQAQSSGSHLAFTGQDGTVDLDRLAVVEH